MKRSVALVLALQLGAIGSLACATVTTDVSRGRSEGPAAGPAHVRVAIFDSRSDVQAGAPAPHPVASRLSRLEGKKLVPVFDAKESAWAVPDLPPGKYVFAVTAWTDANGKTHAEGSEEGFHVAAGESVTIKAILRDRRRNGALTVLTVGGGAIVVYVVYTAINSLTHLSLDPKGTSGR